jgi:mRNA interferase MazF
MVIKQYEIFLINLDPTLGSEIKKSRPCVVISPDEMNKYINTIIIAPMTTTSKPYPSRVAVTFLNNNGFVILDQIRTVDKIRIIKKLGKFENKTIKEIKKTIKEMLVD